MQQKKYYYHNTRPGSLKEMTMERMAAKWGGGEILKRAVRGMLPKNRLRDERVARLKCVEGPYHPYTENILKLRHGASITQLPDVKATLEQARPTAPQ